MERRSGFGSLLMAGMALGFDMNHHDREAWRGVRTKRVGGPKHGERGKGKRRALRLQRRSNQRRHQAK